MKEQIGVITEKVIAGLIIVIIVSCAFLSAVCPSARADSTWDKTYGGAEDDTAAGETVQASDGGYAILGDTDSFGAGGSDFWLIKTDADGNMQWNKTYGGTGTETSGDMCLTSDGGYAMSGYTTSFGVGGQDFWLVKLDSSGTVEWNMTYGGTVNDVGIHVLQTGDGGYALLGYTSSFGAGSNDAWLIKTDAAGNMLWNMTYGGTGLEFGQCLEPTSDGGYAIACITTSFGAGILDFWLVKLDSSGNMEWNMTYGGTGSDGPTHFIQTEDEGYAIVGFTTIGSDQNASLIKTDKFGNMEWNQTYGGTGEEISYALLETSDGYYLLTINTDSFGAGGDDIWLVKTIPEGLTIGVMLLLSTVAATVGIRILRKRPKWKRR